MKNMRDLTRMLDTEDRRRTEWLSAEAAVPDAEVNTPAAAARRQVRLRSGLLSPPVQSPHEAPRMEARGPVRRHRSHRRDADSSRVVGRRTVWRTQVFFLYSASGVGCCMISLPFGQQRSSRRGGGRGTALRCCVHREVPPKVPHARRGGRYFTNVLGRVAHSAFQLI